MNSGIVSLHQRPTGTNYVSSNNHREPILAFLDSAFFYMAGCFYSGRSGIFLLTGLDERLSVGLTYSAGLLFAFYIVPRALISVSPMRIRLSTAIFYGGLFLIWSLFTVFWFDGKTYLFPFIGWPSDAAFFVASLYVASSTADPIRTCKSFLKGLVFGGSLLALAIVLRYGAQALISPLVDMSFTIGDEIHRNSVGGSFAVAACSALFLMGIVEARYRFLIISIFILFFILTIATLSKSSTVAMAIACLLGFAMQMRRYTLMVCFGAVAGVAAVWYVLPYLLSNFDAYVSSGGAATLTFRTVLWSDALSKLEDPLRVMFGYGYNSSAGYSIWFLDQINNLHNDLINTVYTTGVVGMIIIVGYMWCAIVEAARIRNRALPGDTTRWVGSGLLLFYVFFIIRGITECNIGLSQWTFNIFMVFTAIGSRLVHDLGRGVKRHAMRISS